MRRHDPSTAGQISNAAEIIALRNVLIHAYDDIDSMRIWQIIERGLPTLYSELERVMQRVIWELESEDLS